MGRAGSVSPAAGSRPLLLMHWLPGLLRPLVGTTCGCRHAGILRGVPGPQLTTLAASFFFFSLCPEGLTALKTNIWPTYASSSAGYLCHPLLLSLLPCEAGVVPLLQRKHLPRETRINSTSSHPRPVLLLSSEVMSSPELFYILSRQECNYPSTRI